jgi:hypothetical protein
MRAKNSSALSRLCGRVLCDIHAIFQSKGLSQVSNSKGAGFNHSKKISKKEYFNQLEIERARATGSGRIGI